MHVVSTLEPLVVTVQSVLPVGIWTALDRVSERSTSSVDSSDRLTDGSSCSLGEGMPIDRLNFQLSVKTLTAESIHTSILEHTDAEAMTRSLDADEKGLRTVRTL